MILMATRQIIPGVESYIAKLGKAARAKLAVSDDPSLIRMERELITRLSVLNTAAYDGVAALRQADLEAHSAGDTAAIAAAYRDKVIPAMAALRAPVDEMETLVASEDWPLPTYGEMMHKQ